MKILMIAPTPFFSDRGCHVRIYEETKALQNLGHQVVICTYHNGRDIPGLTIRRIVNIPWYTKQEAGPSLHKIYLDVLLLIRTLLIAYKIKPDVIHAHLHEGCFIGIFIKMVIKKPLIFDYQGSISEEMISHHFLKPSSKVLIIIRIIEQKINNLADMILTSSQIMQKNLQSDKIIQKSKIRFTMDGVDIDIFKPGLNSDILKKKLNLPKNKKIVGYLGLLNEYQGISCLLEAIKTVVQHRTDVHFLIMGFPDETKYMDDAKQLGVLEYITFTGKINYSDAPQYLAIPDIAVSPKLSKTEANGKLYNYMACGLPTVVFDSPVNREILGELGIYAKTFGESKAFADAIEYTLNNENQLVVLRIKLRTRAVQNFSWEAVAKKIVNSYLETIKIQG
jgi:glycosyltransferase involved in cell wall biosynthesis